MPRVAKGLTIRRVEQAKPGMWADGHDLYLAVRPGSKSRIFRYQIRGKRHEMGLGSYPVVTLAMARDKAIDHQRAILAGADPLQDKRTGKAARRVIPTVAEAADAYIRETKSKLRDGKAWPDTFRLHVNPKIGSLPVNQVDEERVLACVEPLWLPKHKTATLVRARLEKLLDWARVKKYRTGDNPARWRGHFENLVEKVEKSEAHHAALHWHDAPAFIAELKKDEGIPAVAALFAIYTCTRASEAAGATWDEIDIASSLWTIPASRTKAKREHRVPLSEPAMAILRRMKAVRRNSDNRVFLPRSSGVVAAPAMLKAVLRIRNGITLHGFRSTFRDWAEETGKNRELAEMALGHAVGSHVERSYRRTDLVEQRRQLAEAWAKHCSG